MRVGLPKSNAGPVRSVGGNRAIENGDNFESDERSNYRCNFTALNAKKINTRWNCETPVQLSSTIIVAI